MGSTNLGVALLLWSLGNEMVTVSYSICIVFIPVTLMPCIRDFFSLEVLIDNYKAHGFTKLYNNGKEVIVIICMFCHF